ncbi:hypothetical protein HDU96_000168 [Phlyctochytrium bullatum]|nr:hypothetical protein HDU96_000168 [Phlyctochytrium bullatum]
MSSRRLRRQQQQKEETQILRQRGLNAKEASLLAHPGDLSNLAFAFTASLKGFNSMHTFLFAARAALDGLTRMHPLLRSRIVLTPVPKDVSTTTPTSPASGATADANATTVPTPTTPAAPNPSSPSDGTATPSTTPASSDPEAPLSRRHASAYRLLFEELPARHPSAIIPIRVITLEEEAERRRAETDFDDEFDLDAVAVAGTDPVTGDADPAAPFLDRALERYLAEELSTPLPLARGPLARLTVLVHREGPAARQTCRVIFTLARCAFDGRGAMEVLRRWTALVYGIPVPPPVVKRGFVAHPKAPGVPAPADVAKAIEAAAEGDTVSPPMSRPGTPPLLETSSAMQTPQRSLSTRTSLTTLACDTTPPSRTLSPKTSTSSLNDAVTPRTLSARSSTSSLADLAAAQGAAGSAVAWGRHAPTFEVVPSRLRTWGRYAAFALREQAERYWMATAGATRVAPGWVLDEMVAAAMAVPAVERPLAVAGLGIEVLSSAASRRARTRVPKQAQTRVHALELTASETDAVVGRARAAGVSVSAMLAGALAVAVAPFSVAARKAAGKGAVYAKDLGVALLGAVEVDSRGDLGVPPDWDGAYDASLFVSHERVRVVVGGADTMLVPTLPSKGRGASAVAATSALAAFALGSALFELYHQATVQAVHAHRVLSAALVPGKELHLESLRGLPRFEAWRYAKGFRSPSMAGLVGGGFARVGKDGEKHAADEALAVRPFFVPGLDLEDDPASLIAAAAARAAESIGAEGAGGVAGNGAGGLFGGMGGLGGLGGLFGSAPASPASPTAAKAKKPAIEPSRAASPAPDLNVPQGYAVANLGKYGMPRREEQDEEMLVGNVHMASTVRLAGPPGQVAANVVTVDGRMVVTLAYRREWVDARTVKSVAGRLRVALLGKAA